MPARGPPYWKSRVLRRMAPHAPDRGAAAKLRALHEKRRLRPFELTRLAPRERSARGATTHGDTRPPNVGRPKMMLDSLTRSHRKRPRPRQPQRHGGRRRSRSALRREHPLRDVRLDRHRGRRRARGREVEVLRRLDAVDHTPPSAPQLARTKLNAHRAIEKRRSSRLFATENPTVAVPGAGSHRPSHA